MHKIFGIKEDAEYFDREGAYIIPLRGNKVGVVETPKGYFFLGGGLENGESYADCIKRECLEEAGYTVVVGEKICSAETYCEHPTIGHFHPIQAYYTGEIIEKVAEPTDADHRFLWVDYDYLKGKMFAEMQNWALEQKVNGVFVYMNKAEVQTVLPMLYDIMFENMKHIVPEVMQKEEFISAVSLGLNAENRRILLFYEGKELAGFLQYFVSKDGLTFRIEELQIKRQYQMRGLFLKLMRFMLKTLPEDIKYIEAFVHAENTNSRRIQSRLGLAEVGSKDGIIHMCGDYTKIRKKYSNRIDSKFKFINSSCIKIELAECQKMQLSSKEKIEAALTSNDVISFDIYTYPNVLIGFAMLHNCGDGWFLWNYAIDVNFQNQHYGQRALGELCELLKLKYNAKWITTTYKHGNEIARRMYERVGFVQTDIVCENGIHEINMILHL